jgi:hypothetical protein
VSFLKPVPRISPKRLRSFIKLLLLAPLSFLACSSSVEPDEAAVIAVLFKGLQDQPTGPVYICSSTLTTVDSSKHEEWVVELLGPAGVDEATARELFAGLLAASRYRGRLPGSVLPESWQLLPSTGLRDRFTHWLLTMPVSDCPEGGFSVSRPGLDESRTRALLYWRNATGGFFFLLERKGDRWILEPEAIAAWIS